MSSNDLFKNKTAAEIEAAEALILLFNGYPNNMMSVDDYEVNHEVVTGSEMDTETDAKYPLQTNEATATHNDLLPLDLTCDISKEVKQEADYEELEDLQPNSKRPRLDLVPEPSPSIMATNYNQPIVSYQENDGSRSLNNVSIQVQVNSSDHLYGFKPSNSVSSPKTCKDKIKRKVANAIKESSKNKKKLFLVNSKTGASVNLSSGGRGSSTSASKNQGKSAKHPFHKVIKIITVNLPPPPQQAQTVKGTCRDVADDMAAAVQLDQMRKNFMTNQVKYVLQKLRDNEFTQNQNIIRAPPPMEPESDPQFSTLRQLLTGAAEGDISGGVGFEEHEAMYTYRKIKQMEQQSKRKDSHFI